MKLLGMERKLLLMMLLMRRERRRNGGCCVKEGLWEIGAEVLGEE